MPVKSQFGDRIEIMYDTGTGYIIAQNAGQSIKINNSSSTVGTGGSVASTNYSNMISIVCSVANTKWFAESASGNFKVV